MSGNSGKKSNKNQELNEKRIRAYQLRKEGHAVVDIAVELGCSPTAVYRYIADGREAYYDLYPEERQHVKNLELSRLDDMTITIFAKAKSGDCRAAETMLRIMERRARLLGLDEPARQEIETKNAQRSAEDLTDDELADIIKAGGQ